MAARSTRTSSTSSSSDAKVGIAVTSPETPPAPGFTGRYLVSMHRGAISDGLRLLRTSANLNIAATSDFGGGVIRAAGAAGANAFVLERLGIAVVDAPPEQLRVIKAASDTGPVRHITRERYVHIATPGPTPGTLREYLAGYRDGVNQLTEALTGRRAEAPSKSAVAGEIPSESDFTWGLQVTGVAATRLSGSGIKVAVLDTGMDLGHPDFTGRAVVSQSFVAGFPTAHDGHGHGTHCIGTACGPKRPGNLPTYGVASQAELYVGKVLSDAGSGVDFDILAGINWALEQGCQVVSISIGKHTFPGERYESLFEDTAKQGLDEGLVIFAAAGNDSSRPFSIEPVSHPANCPSIFAVAAVDPQSNPAPFSNGAVNPDGGEINIAGPGVSVRSSWPKPQLYNTMSGTSMATPHVAGIAALMAEATGLRGRALADRVLGAARKLSAASSDVGAGLVQSP